MTTVIIVNADDQQPAIREILESVVDDGETVYFLRLPAIRCLGSLIQELNPMCNYDVEYTIDCLPEGYDVTDLVRFAMDVDATRICIGITDRTLTGKVQIDDLTQSILLHESISGDFVVGNHAIILEELEYDS
ncbi:hypothetical protein RBH26_17465 [Natronolimnohabitans sp. A-GB9]|uniref:hypothetical protein n=1 Tax=Natronolimnohabitans sp. A-GB9 TaxID=3069757 RepID=UPI0027B0BBAA|nr:hypothetical protein [Natronolimnohabitans sp. A-GB9]MDQ2052264.1 hypothetical protein [Natronolimnohabitans sp. A-GB9]